MGVSLGIWEAINGKVLIFSYFRIWTWWNTFSSWEIISDEQKLMLTSSCKLFYSIKFWSLFFSFIWIEFCLVLV